MWTSGTPEVYAWAIPVIAFVAPGGRDHDARLAGDPRVDVGH
jgi:hypothetical protein